MGKVGRDPLLPPTAPIMMFNGLRLQGLPVGVPSLVANGQISSSRSCPRSTSGNKVYYLPDIKTLTMDLSVKTSNYRHLTAKTSVPQRYPLRLKLIPFIPSCGIAISMSDAAFLSHRSGSEKSKHWLRTEIRSIAVA
uniref:Uncharacterized protein n=1 Tax=Coccidioides posadasii RMSCC 3488 TaxID=454284 RepID=A0A0J6F7B0_COCPO|nr:hypothetical protein CPAG_01517 [Coccidioides posadasii RMSCC 3488]